MASMVELGFRIDAVLGGSFSRAFNNAGLSIIQLQQQTANLQQKQKQIQSFQAAEKSIAQLSQKYQYAKDKLKNLGAQILNTDKPTAKLNSDFVKASNEVFKLERAFGTQTETLNKLRTSLNDAGINTSRLASEQQCLQQQTQQTTEAQNRLTQARARFEAAKQKLSLDTVKSEVITALGAFRMFQKSVQVSMDFEAAMARVNAVAFSGAGRNKAQDAKDFALLQKQAQELGASTQFTAVQAANTQENLARAGFKANEIISAMPGLLNMAAAEGMDLAQAADIAAGALRGFNLQAGDMDKVANVLAQTSAASNTNIAELGEAMKYVAPVASGLGISIEQTNAMLGAMANNAIKGSQAGTSLRAALLRLSKEPAAVAKALGELGIKATDAQGRLREMPELMQALSRRMQGLGEAKQMQYLANIFGAEASAGMLAVMKDSTSGALQRLEFFNKASDGVMKEILNHVNGGVENSVVSFEEMQQAMQNSGYYAESLGISFNDLAVDLALLARSGIKGADADKALTLAFKQLKEQPAKVQNALKQFNISMKDSSGGMKGFLDIVQELKPQIMSLDQTKRLNLLEQIFGKGTGSAIQALMKTATDESIAGYKNAMKQAQSISSEMAGKNQDTLAGQLTVLSSAWEGLLNTIGTSLEPAIKPLVDGLNTVLTLVNDALNVCPPLTTAIVDLFAAFAAYKTLKTVWNIGKNVLDLFGAWRAVSTAAAAANGVFTTSQVGLNAAMSANPIGAVITALNALIAVGYLVYANWDMIKEYGVKMWGWIQEKVQWFSDFWATIELKNLFEPIINFAYDCIEGLKGIWQSFKDWIVGLFDFNLFSSFQAPQLSSEQIETAKSATKNKYGTLDLTPSYMKHAAGGIFSTPHLGLVAEAGREAIIPLGNKSRGIPLWKAAGEELGFSFGGNVNNDNSSKSVSLSPVFNFTINNTDNQGGIGLEARLRSIVEDCLANIQNEWERVSFA